MLEILFKVQVEKSEELKYVLQVYARETTSGDKKYDSLQIEMCGRKTSRAENQGLFFKARNRDEDRPAA